MKIVKMVERELTEKELCSIERFRSYTDGVSFALVGDDVTVMIDDTETNDPEELKAAAIRTMNELLTQHPDFDVFKMDDGCTMILTVPGVISFSSTNPELSGLALHLMLRQMCIEASERGEVIAVAFEDYTD